MALILDRAEFYALVVLFRARMMVGLDPAALVAGDLESQQSLFNQGRDQLRERDLIRLTEHGAIDVDSDLRDLFTAIVMPDQVVLTIRRMPAGERSLLLFYGHDDLFVELTIPRTGIYRLDPIGTAEAVIVRLLQILPLTDQPFVPEALTLSGSMVAEAFQQVMKHDATHAQMLLEASPSDNATLARYLVDVFASATFAGNITLVRPTMGGTIQSKDITVIHSPDESWSLISENGSDRLWAERMNATALRSTLKHALLRTSPAVV